MFYVNDLYLASIIKQLFDNLNLFPLQYDVDLIPFAIICFSSINNTFVAYM